MISKSASFIATLGLALLSSQNTFAQKIFMSYGEGVCVDSAGAQYDALETSDVESTADCQSRCTTLDATYLRGIQYEGSTKTCDCLYENDVGFPGNAFSEIGADEGEGAVAGVNSTFTAFSCYKFSGGAFSLMGTGGCVDSDSEYYSFATPLNVQGTQTATDCQNGCIAAGTDGLVGLDYDGECYCLYDEDAAPVVASTVTIRSNSGTGDVSGISTFAGIECQAFAMPPTPAPTPPPTPAPTPVRGNGNGNQGNGNGNQGNGNGNRGGDVAGVVSVPTVGKAPKTKAVKAPTLETRGTKLSTGKAPAAIPKNPKRRRRKV